MSILDGNGKGNSTMNAIGEAIQRTRSIYGYKASELCEMLEISTSYFSEIENGKKSASIELLQKYSDVLGIKLSSFLLLSEKLQEAKLQNRSHEFARQIMLHMIAACHG